MKYKTSELSGELLDEAVVIASGYMRARLVENGEKLSGCRVWKDAKDHFIKKRGHYGTMDLQNAYITLFNPSSNWKDGGPIIEKSGINVLLRYGSSCRHNELWDATIKPEFFTSGRAGSGVQKEVIQTAHTPLIAAMRALVQSKLGDEVEL